MWWGEGGSFRKVEGGSKPGGNYDLLFLNCERHDSELFSMSNLTKYFSEKSFYIEQSHFKKSVKNNRSIRGLCKSLRKAYDGIFCKNN